MNLTCCVCGKELWESLSQALEYEGLSRLERSPTIGIVCKPCDEKLERWIDDNIFQEPDE